MPISCTGYTPSHQINGSAFFLAYLLHVRGLRKYAISALVQRSFESRTRVTSLQAPPQDVSFSTVKEFQTAKFRACVSLLKLSDRKPHPDKGSRPQ
ncbi:hypothetical protein TNCV_339731 [Trichonephila clavipes]|nr:hypothetical protein TNCV_339731 [Trichonephila clavipes]